MGEYASRSIYLEIAKRDEGTKMASAEVKLAEICLKLMSDSLVQKLTAFRNHPYERACGRRGFGMRRGRDSNPRSPFEDTAFPVLHNRPLCHLSVELSFSSLFVFSDHFYGSILTRLVISEPIRSSAKPILPSPQALFSHRTRITRLRQRPVFLFSVEQRLRCWLRSGRLLPSGDGRFGCWHSANATRRCVYTALRSNLFPATT